MNDYDSYFNELNDNLNNNSENNQNNENKKREISEKKESNKVSLSDNIKEKINNNNFLNNIRGKTLSINFERTFLILVVVIIVAVLIVFFLPINLKLAIDGNNIIDNQKLKCSTTIIKHKCNITLPILPNNKVPLVYNHDSTSHRMEYNSSEEITLTKSTTLYVVEEEKITYTATFDGNGAKLSKNILTCSGYQSRGGCTITPPTVTRSGYEILGFNKDNTKQATLKVKNKISLTEENNTFYVVSKKNLYALFSTEDKENETSQLISCAVYNSDSSCSITVPKFKKYGTNYGTYKTSFVNCDGDKAAILRSNLEYVVSGQTYKLDASDILIGNKYTKLFHSMTKSGVSYYKMDNSWISSIETISDTNLVFDKACKKNSEYLTFMKLLYQKTPYLFNNLTNIQFYSSAKFRMTTGLSNLVAGVTYANSVIINCDYGDGLEDFDYVVIIHELSHVQNSRLSALTKVKSFSSKYLSLMNKYKYMSYYQRPLRSYSYTDVEEFVAELYAYYHATTIEGFDDIPYYNKIDNTLKSEAQSLECYYKAKTTSELNQCN